MQIHSPQPARFRTSAELKGVGAIGVIAYENDMFSAQSILIPERDYLPY
jgi:hypothetical protein